MQGRYKDKWTRISVNFGHNTSYNGNIKNCRFVNICKESWDWNNVTLLKIVYHLTIWIMINLLDNAKISFYHFLIQKHFAWILNTSFVNLWNSLEDNLKNSPSLGLFKRRFEWKFLAPFKLLLQFCCLMYVKVFLFIHLNLFRKITFYERSFPLFLTSLL